DVVEVVADDVDVAVARVVGGGAVPGNVGAAVALRIPDHVDERVRRERGADGRKAETAETRVHLRPSVDYQGDARERLSEGGGGVIGTARGAVCVVGAVVVPVSVHLGQRPHVHGAIPAVEPATERDEIPVAR